MKFATLRLAGALVPALVDTEAGLATPIRAAHGEKVASLQQLLEMPTLQPADLVLDAGAGVALEGAPFAAPLQPRRNILCVGKNYHAHAQEFTRSGFDSSARNASEAIPEHPIVFTKFPETVIATGEHIVCPRPHADSLDYEAEIAVVIGTGGQGIAQADAMRHVWGYALANDVTSRDMQGRHKQWFLGKSLDTFCPMGPWITTSGELDGAAIDLRCWVNGELRQSANTRDLIFNIPVLIATISAAITLLPGDIILTGTPAGVGIGFQPPRFLKSGDEVRIEAPGLGTLVNRVR